VVVVVVGGVLFVLTLALRRDLRDWMRGLDVPVA
jgi:hypothetical protein